ncbi:MAG: glutamine synthetase family protein [Lachnospiraceae bacterium]|nr:glutamine synthetase family protein [Clostridiales bacterium]MDY3109450.1 glutamine synthetase family protein [Lachnospiraceae bacterium]
MKTREQIMQLIEDEDVEFIRLQFTDMFGNLKNIAITPGQLEKIQDCKYPFESSAVFDDLYDPEENLFLVPDLDSFTILPWRPQQGKVAKFICDVIKQDGTPYTLSPRTILKNVLEDAKKEGYTFVVDPECEFFLFHTDDNGTPTTITHEKAGYLDVGPLDLGENARREMVLTLEDMGFEIESSHHEKAPAQHEIDFTQAEALDTADALMNFKFAIRSTAKRFGLYATFMPKPRTDLPGSGMHLHISMYKNGENLFDDDDGEASAMAGFFMGGVMEHARALCAITNPVVNSYKRILTGYHAPKEVYWAKKGEKALLKYHNNGADTKVELRFPDPSANPYLAIAVCIAAGMDGIHKQISPGEANCQSGRYLPGNLKDALDCMKQDNLMKATLGEEFVKLYTAIKYQEWNEYMLQVSDWEVDRYLAKM